MSQVNLNEVISKKSGVAATTIVSLSVVAAKYPDIALWLSIMMTVVALSYMSLDFVKQLKKVAGE